MSKKLLSILCALAMLVSMTAIAVVTVSADDPTLNMAAISATGSSALAPKTGNSGYIKTEITGDAVWTMQQSAPNWAKADIGTYDIGDYFKLDCDMFYFYIGDKAGSTAFVINVGKLELAFTSTATASQFAITAKYDGADCAIVDDDDTDTENDAIWIKDQNKSIDKTALVTQVTDYLTSKSVNPSWMVKTNYAPNNRMPVSVKYESGALTITNREGLATKVFTVTLPAGANFAGASVALTAKVNDANASTHGSALGNFSGEYKEPVVVSSSDTSSETSSVDNSSETSSATSSQTTSSEKPHEVVTTDMGGLGTATCVIPEDLGWNAQGSGLVKTSLTGDALFVAGQNNEVNLTANVGTYAIDKYFKLNFDLFAKNGKSEPNGIGEGNENWIVTVGDFVFTFTRPTLEAKELNEQIMLKSVTYKGTQLPIQGETNYGINIAVKHDHRSTETLAAAAELNTLLENRVANGDIKNISWVFKNGLPNAANFYPTFHHNVEIVYDNGKITITVGAGNTAGNAPVVATVDATSVVDTSKELGACGVSVNLHSTAKRGSHISAFGNFKGAYEKGTATTGGGSGTNGGNGANGGNGGKNPSTGDTRNIALPICLAVAFVAVAGSAVLLCKKRA